MEGVSGRQPAAGHAEAREVALESLDLLRGAGEDAEVGSVHRRQRQAAERQLVQPLRGQETRLHRARRQARDEPRPLRHEAQAFLQGEDPGGAGRRVLAQAVAEHRFRPHAPGLPEPHQRHLQGEDRGMGQLGALRVGLGPGRHAAEHAPQVWSLAAAVLPPLAALEPGERIAAGERAQDLGAAVDLAAEDLLRLVHAPRHAGVVIADAGEQEGHGAAVEAAVAAQQPLRIAPGEGGDGVVAVAADQHPPVAQRPPAGLQGVGGVGEALLRMRLEMHRETIRGAVKGRRRGGREDQQLAGAGRSRGLPRGRLLQHHVGVGAAHAEGVDAGAARRPRRRLPVFEPGGDAERAAFKRDLRVRL